MAKHLEITVSLSDNEQEKKKDIKYSAIKISNIFFCIVWKGAGAGKRISMNAICKSVSFFSFKSQLGFCEHGKIKIKCDSPLWYI